MQLEEIERAVNAAVDTCRRRVGALLPALHAVQEQLGFIPAEAVPILARALNLSRSEVHGVIGFYHDFRTEPPARHRIRLCRAEACQSMGARDIEAELEARLGVRMGASSPDGRYALEPVYCLGNCSCAPSLQVNDKVHARVSSERLAALLENLEGET